LPFASTAFALTRYDFINNPKKAQAEALHYHSNFTVPKIQLKEYKPSATELKDLRNKILKAKGIKKPANTTTATGAHGLTANTASASNPLQGVVAAFIQPYGFVGYVALQLTSFFHTSPLTSDLNSAALVTLPSANPSPNFELAIANASAPFLGDIEGYSGSNWGPGNAGYGSMTVVQSSSWPATNRNNPTGLPSESGFWTMDASNGQLTAVWFNDDGTKVDCTIFADATYGDLNFAGDLAAFLNIYPDNVYVTTLYFVPLSYFGL